MKKVDYFNGFEWVTKNEEQLRGVDDIKNVEEIFESVDERIEVHYKNGEKVFYKNNRREYSHFFKWEMNRKRWLELA